MSIYRISDESRNFYNDVQNASTSEEFSNLKSQSISAVYDYNSGQTDQTTTASPYKVSIPSDLKTKQSRVLNKILKN